MVKVIYALKHPKTGSVRYIGATATSLSRRLSVHVSTAYKSTSAVALWIRFLLSAGLRPRIVALSLPTPEWEQAEALHIRARRRAGARLLNMTEGGMGARGCYPSAITRSKRSATLKSRYAEDPAQLVVRQELARSAGRSPKAREAASKRMGGIWSDPGKAEDMRRRMVGAKARKATRC